MLDRSSWILLRADLNHVHHLDCMEDSLRSFFEYVRSHMSIVVMSLTGLSQELTGIATKMGVLLKLLYKTARETIRLSDSTCWWPAKKDSLELLRHLKALQGL